MSPVLHPAIKEALAVHEAYRRLHFTADEIFVVLDKQRQLFVMVRRGGREFHTLVGVDFQATADTLRAHWEQACHAWNVTMTEAERQAIYSASRISKTAAPFVAAIVAKGFSIAPIQA